MLAVVMEAVDHDSSLVFHQCLFLSATARIVLGMVVLLALKAVEGDLDVEMAERRLAASVIRTSEEVLFWVTSCSKPRVPRH